MFDWRVDILLNCGQNFTCRYQGYEKDSNELVKKLLNGKRDMDFVDLYNQTMTTAIFFKIGDISAIEFSPWKNEDDLEYSIKQWRQEVRKSFKED